jgi:hypothetical protein
MQGPQTQSNGPETPEGRNGPEAHETIAGRFMLKASPTEWLIGYSVEVEQ